MVHPTPRAFPSAEANSGIYGFRPHLQRRDREGLAPSSLTQESQCGGTLGEEENVVKFNNEQPLTTVTQLQRKNRPG